MPEVQVTPGIKLSGDDSPQTLDVIGMQAVAEVYLWDLGPEKPTQPKKPETPRGKNGDPDYELAKVEFEEELETYREAIKTFKRHKDEFAAWQTRYGGPVEYLFDHPNAVEAIANDARAVAEGRQTRLRWYVSSRTRNKSRLPNRGLPEGMKPGHGQADQERRAAEGETDLIAARRADPVFGQTELRS